MSLTTLIDDLSENTNALHDAMLSGDIEGIEGAIETFREAVEQLKVAGQWPNDSVAREKIVALLPQLDDHRALACLLADMTGQMHEMAAARARDVRQTLHAQSGDRFA